MPPRDRPAQPPLLPHLRQKAGPAWGFGLVEPLVALAVLVVAMGGVFYVLERTLRWTKEARLAAAAEARLGDAVEALAASPGPSEAGGPVLWEPGSQRVEGIQLEASPGEPSLATGVLTTVVSDVRRNHEGRELRLRAARIDLEYTFRGHTHTQRRVVLRGFDP